MPAITRTEFGTSLIVNYDDYTAPCWVGLGLEGVFYPMFNPIMGFDHKKQWLILGGTAEFADASVSILDLSKCAGGTSPISTLISSVDGAALFASALPGGATQLSASWMGATQDRLYAFSRYDDGGTISIKAWSVNYSGGDYNERFILSNSGGVLGPIRLDAMDGSVLGGETDDGSSHGAIIDDGASAVSGMDAMGGGAAVVRVGDSYLWSLNDGLLGVPAGLTGLFVGSPGSVLDSAVSFAPLETVSGTPTTVEYLPASLGWDELRSAAVVHWIPFPFGVSGWIPKAPQGYVTYIKQAITPGNIIGQDGVDIYLAAIVGYGFGTAGGGFVQSGAPPASSIILPGKLPTPLTVTAGALPDPPVAPPDCSLFLDCVTETQAFLKLFGDGLTAHTDAASGGDTIDGVGVTLESRSFDDLTINIVLHDVAYLSGGVIPDDGGRPAAGLDAGSGSMKRYWAPVGTYGDSGDPGLRVFSDNFDAGPTYHRAQYLCGVVAEVTCSGGQGRVETIRFEWQGFKGHEGGGTEPWPAASVDVSFTYLGAPLAQNDGSDDLLLGVPADCAMSGILQRWFFSSILNSGPSLGSLEARSFCIVQPLV